MGHSPSLALSRHPLLPAYGDLGRHRAGRGDHLFHRQRPRSRHRRARRPATQCDDSRARRHRARRARLAPRPCAARHAAALSRPGRALDRGPALLCTFRHRSARAGTRLLPQCLCRQRGRGRLDHHPAARQEFVPQPAAHLRAETRRGRLRDLARAALLQGRDPRALSQSGLFRRRYLWGRGRLAPLFRQVGPLRHAVAGSPAGGSPESALALRADAQRQGRQCARRRGARQHGRGGIPLSGAGAQRQPTAAAAVSQG